MAPEIELLTIGDLHVRLVHYMRALVRHGFLSEAGLARRTHLSQPHIHHVLAGRRALTAASADLIIESLGLGILDLVTTAELAAYLDELTRRVPAADVPPAVQ